VGGNTLQVDGSLDTASQGLNDTWTAVLAAPYLNRLAPLLQLTRPEVVLQSAKARDQEWGGQITAAASVNGRWPLLASTGQLQAQQLRLGATRIQSAQAQWQWGTSPQAPIDVQATLIEASLASAPRGVTTDNTALSNAAAPQSPIVRAPGLAQLQLSIQGTGAVHTLLLQGESTVLPPAWTQALTPPGLEAVPSTTSRTVGSLQIQGGFVDSVLESAATSTAWRGLVKQLELRPRLATSPPLLRTTDVGLEVQWGSKPTRITVQPGRASVLGSTLRWSRGVWQAAAQPGSFAQIELQADLEPLAVAPLLARAQPNFGWGGDLALRGRLDLRSAPSFQADIVFERHVGDLTVTDELGGTQALGLSDLRVGLNADNGVWTFTQGLAGKTLGVAAGAVVARTSPAASWPPPNTPIEGVLELQVANLGTWGTWAPPGWRLDGALRTSATIGGRLNAPEYTGQIRGTDLSVRNFLQGVNVTQGDLLIALEGNTARVERFTAQAGAGLVKLQGAATLGESPKAQLKLSADKFQLLGRIDRRLVTSGQAQLTLDQQTVALSGSFVVDEGAIDFTRSDAPALASDVQVARKPSSAAAPSPFRAATNVADSSVPAITRSPTRNVALDLRVNLGPNLRLRGRGLDTQLQGELHLTSPRQQLVVNGTVQTVNGTYAAYGQKLTIDRGVIVFSGPVDNPRLDIEATRPNLDTRVGVAVTGSTTNPRVRLFSEPELPEIEKLSWLVLGRGSDGLGRTDTALLQRAALALLAGEGDSVTDQLTKAIGLDEISLRQSDGEVRETVISLGKQLSRRWYVGYERGLNATTGSWQLIYRIAQRFTLRAQSGLDNSLDLIWTWRWQ
jgi:translocation and assembly module TamB